MFHLDRSFIRGATVQINITNCKIAHILEIILMNSYDFWIFRATKKIPSVLFEFDNFFAGKSYASQHYSLK